MQLFFFLILWPHLVFGLAQSEPERTPAYEELPSGFLKPEVRYPISISTNNLRNEKAPDSVHIIQQLKNKQIPWLGIIALLAGLIFVLTQRKEKMVKTRKRPQFQLLAMQKVAEADRLSDSVTYITALADILRSYIEEKYGINAPAMTTQEFLKAAVYSPQIQKIPQQNLKEFLEKADAVKFAHYIPAHKERQRMETLVQNFLSYV